MAYTTAELLPYQNLPYEAYQQGISDLSDDTNTSIHLALLNDEHSPDRESNNVWSDVNQHEISGTNYSSDGKEIANITWNEDGSDDRVYFDGDNVSWDDSSLTARYGVVFDYTTGVASSSPLMCLLDFGGNVASKGDEFTVKWGDAQNSPDGIFEVNYRASE